MTARVPFSVLAIWLDGCRVVRTTPDRLALMIWRDGSPTVDVIGADGIRLAQVKVPPLPPRRDEQIDAIEGFIEGLLSGARAREEMPFE